MNILYWIFGSPISLHQRSARPRSSSRFLLMSRYNRGRSHTVYLQNPTSITLPLVGILVLHTYHFIQYSTDPLWISKHCFPCFSVFRTFWSIFLITGVAAVVIGGFVVICAGPLTNHKLYKVGGVLQLCGGLCLLAVLVMYLMWVQVLDTLEQFVLHQRASRCPSFHLSIQHGPSFLLAPVAVFFCLLAGLLFILIGQNIHCIQLERKTNIPDPELALPETYL
ncbi:hypothetical protein PAMA_014422 [Pampus argenteus]